MNLNDRKIRILFLFGFLVAMMGLFLFRLAQLQIVNGEYYQAAAENKMLRRINESAPRGNIFTSDGYQLAKNRIGYSVDLTYADMDEEVRNDVFLRLYRILEKNNETFLDAFPIVMVNGEFVFTFYLEELQWKSENRIPAEADARQTLDIMRERYNVKPEVNDAVALEAIEKVHLEQALPLLSREGTLLFRFQHQETLWKQSYGFKEEELTFTAEAAFDKLRTSFDIDDTYSDDDARKIMIFRQILKNQGFRSWEPVEITRDVALATVLEIDENVHDLPGVSVVARPIREYPYGSLASHVIGYIGKVGDKDVEDGYQMTDMKGVTGIEAAYETYLKGEDGVRLAITDHLGRPQDIDSDESLDPVPGMDAQTTIDYDLQRVAEEALANQIQTIRANNRAPQASSGAAVVIDVKTGAVLAMASYPDYDPNLFVTGISTADWKNLNVVVSDPLYPKPLYNNATMTALQPGSTFKPLLAIAGLEKGVITQTSTIFCNRVHPVFTQFTCLGRHGSETVVDALRDSCNVFFYETGYRLGVDALEAYISDFGLGKRTGLEIAESAGYLATKTEKKQVWTYSLSDYLRKTVGIEGTGTIINDEGKEQLVYKSYAIAKELFDEVDETNFKTYGDVYRKAAEILQKYNLRDTRYLHRITDYILAGRWVVSDTINASIGQGGNSFTPIQMANAMATLVNGGNRMETYLVSKVTDFEGKVVYEHKPTVVDTVIMSDSNLDAVKRGLKLVTTVSTARSGFVGFDHQNIGVGGKTGTAQYGGSRVDNTGWFTAFAPYENPEIAVAVMIVQGRTSTNALPVARKIIDAYFYDNKTFEQRQQEAAQLLETPQQEGQSTPE
jgi:penicillin-binding protein 2